MAHDEPTDDRFIAALNAGDSSAFEPLYLRYRDWVLRLAWRFTGNDQDALDVLQETFAYFFGKFPGFIRSAALTTFLYPVVKNLSIAARRKTARFAGDEQMLDGLACPQWDAGASRAELAAVLWSLPATHREVLLMRFVDALSLDEIARALCIPLGTVKSRLHNALNTVRDDPRLREYFAP
jgi:RNA polymerase sigma-70 factor (ECF subfamily)